MESNQDVASNNIVKREVQPPTPPKRKKKMSFSVWWALHGSEELTKSTENMEQQDSSLVIDNGSSAKAPQKVDLKGDGQEPQSESNENNQVAFKTCSEEDIPTDKEVSAGNIKKQKDSLAIVEESIAGVQEKVDTIEKEHSKSEERPPKTKICKEELVSFTSEPMTEKKPVTETQKKVNQKGEKQSKTKRNKKKPLLWKSFPETDACIDLTFFTENSEIDDGPLPENQNNQGAFSSSKKKTLWKMLPKSEPCIDVSFFAETIETKNVSMPAECKESELEHMEIQKYLLKQLDDMFKVNEKLNAELKQQKELMRKLLSETRQRKKTTVSVQTQSELQGTSQVSQCVSVQTEMDVPETIYNVKQIRQSVSTQTEMDVLENRCHLEPVYKSIPTQTELFLLLRKQSTETERNRHQDRQTKVFKSSTGENSRESARRDASDLKIVCNETISGENIEKELSVLEIVGDQAEAIKNEIHIKETAIVEVLKVTEEGTVSMTPQNGDVKVEKRRSKKRKSKVKRKASTRDASELDILCKGNVSGDNDEKGVSVLKIAGDQTESIEKDIDMNESAMGEVLPVIEEGTVSMTPQNGDAKVEKRRSKKRKRKVKRKAATRDASEPDSLCRGNVSGTNIDQEVSTIETTGDQTALVKNDIQTIETEISKEQQVAGEKTELGTVSEDVACKVEAVSTEEECGPMKNQTSLPQTIITLNKDEVQTPPQELEPQSAGESAEENNFSEGEENPKKKKSLWKRIKKALTPPPLRLFKNRCKVHPA